MSKKTEAAKADSFSVTLNEPSGTYTWHMLINRFSIASHSMGLLISLGYAEGASYDCSHVARVLLDREGVEQLAKSLGDNFFVGYTPKPEKQLGQTPLTGTKVFAPMFSNLLRVSYRGTSSELGFLSVPISAIADAAKQRKSNVKITPISVGLFHCETELMHDLISTILSTRS